MRTIHDTEFPNSVESTEALLIEQAIEYTKLKVSPTNILKDFSIISIKNSFPGRNSTSWTERRRIISRNKTKS